MPLALEERVGTLEAVLGQFIVSTNRALNRMERGIADLKDEMKADRKEMNRRWGDLANKMGTIVEDIAAPNVPGIARRYFGIETFDFFAIRVKKKNIKDRSMQREFDVVAQTEKEFIVVEVKSNPREEYVDKFVSVLGELADYFPEVSEKKLIPIFASLYIPDNVLSHLTRSEIYAMGMKDDTMDLLNFEDVM